MSRTEGVTKNSPGSYSLSVPSVLNDLLSRFGSCISNSEDHSRRLDLDVTQLANVALFSYASHMETVVHQVRELGDSERSAAEQLVGHPLHENQQLVIQVVSCEP